MGDISSGKNIVIVKRFELATYAEISDKMPSKTPRKCKDDGDDVKKPLWNQSPLEPFVIGSEKSDFITLPFGFQYWDDVLKVVSEAKKHVKELPANLRNTKELTKVFIETRYNLHNIMVVGNKDPKAVFSSVEDALLKGTGMKLDAAGKGEGNFNTVSFCCWCA